MKFLNKDAKDVTMLLGLTRKTLATGQSLMLCEFKFEADVEIPNHSHPHEQVGYVVEGRVRMTVGDKQFELAKGDSYWAPSNVPHGARTLEPTIIVDTFCPPREDYK